MAGDGSEHSPLKKKTQNIHPSRFVFYIESPCFGQRNQKKTLLSREGQGGLPQSYCIRPTSAQRNAEPIGTGYWSAHNPQDTRNWAPIGRSQNHRTARRRESAITDMHTETFVQLGREAFTSQELYISQPLLLRWSYSRPQVKMYLEGITE